MENFKPYQEKKEFNEKIIKKLIIDIVRHVKSRYREYFEKDFKFDNGNNASIDAEGLDITKEGVAELEETARQIETLINKNNEIVLLVTSPSARTQSSLLIIKKYLEKQSVTFLNYNKNFKTKQLRPLDLKNLEADKDKFISKTMEYMNEVGEKVPATDEIKEEIAKRMNREFGDLFAEDSFGSVDSRFKRFVRHMTKINQYFLEDTKKIIGEKQLRILCLSHEELPAKFLKEVYSDEKNLNLQNGQILEIKPSDDSDSGNNSSVRVTLYPKGKENRTMNKEVDLNTKI